MFYVILGDFGKKAAITFLTEYSVRNVIADSCGNNFSVHCRFSIQEGNNFSDLTVLFSPETDDRATSHYIYHEYIVKSDFKISSSKGGE